MRDYTKLRAFELADGDRLKAISFYLQPSLAFSLPAFSLQPSCLQPSA